MGSHASIELTLALPLRVVPTSYPSASSQNSAYGSSTICSFSGQFVPSSRNSNRHSSSGLLPFGSSTSLAGIASKLTQRKVKKDKGNYQPKARPPQSKEKDVTTAVPFYPPEEVFSLDVECVAVGKTHEKTDRAPCSFALVDGYGKVVMQTLIQPSRQIVSYLTPFTGLREGSITSQNAVSLDRAINELKGILPRRAILVGQDPEGDIEWMQLVKGVDFHDMIDLSEVFTNSRGMVFSLRHEARALLGKVPQSGVHNPSWDARVSMELYHKAAQASQAEMAALREKLTDKKFWPPLPSLARECGYKIDGVCLSMYGADHCSCGRPVIVPKVRKA